MRNPPFYCYSGSKLRSVDIYCFLFSDIFLRVSKLIFTLYTSPPFSHKEFLQLFFGFPNNLICTFSGGGGVEGGVIGMKYTLRTANPCLMWANPLLGPLEGVGPWKSQLFAAKMALASLIASSGPNKVQFSGPTLCNGPCNGFAHVLGHINNKYINRYSILISLFYKPVLATDLCSTCKCSTLLHLPRLRFHCDGGCPDVTQDHCNIYVSM